MIKYTINSTNNHQLNTHENNGYNLNISPLVILKHYDRPKKVL